MSQFIKPQIQWTETKIAKLKAEYPLGDKRLLMQDLGITMEALKTAARRFGVKSLKDLHHYRLKPLYENSHLAYYWMGFIMADGHIDSEGELKIGLSVVDRGHLEKLAQLLKANIKDYKMEAFGKIRSYCRLNCKDSHYGILLLKRFGLSNKPKTYHPPHSLNILNDGLFLAFFLGMIDGDGTFSKNKKGQCAFIRLEMHRAWIGILEEIKNRLQRVGFINVYTGLNARGYAYLKVYKHQNLKMLKMFSIHHNLPRLDRKWQSIDETYTFSYMRAGDKVISVQDLINI